jgi:hypothetical protein
MDKFEKYLITGTLVLGLFVGANGVLNPLTASAATNPVNPQAITYFQGVSRENPAQVSNIQQPLPLVQPPQQTKQPLPMQPLTQQPVPIQQQAQQLQPNQQQAQLTSWTLPH